jgi:ATPase subunit of ABC transporter with duplicated ATPase domains
MVHLDNISKQHGHQMLFIDASMGLQRGEKAGLVGPNGAGKTTIFRRIAGEEIEASCDLVRFWAPTIPPRASHREESADTTSPRGFAGYKRP